MEAVMIYVVPDYEFLSIDNKGNCYSTHTGNKLKPFVGKCGYFRIKVWCPKTRKLRGCLVHRAIAKVFIPNPNNLPQVNHIDSDRKNNNLSNLEWVTAKGNFQHGLAAGNIVVGRFGEDSVRSKLTNEQVHEVCAMLQDGFNLVDIEKQTGIKKSNLFDIKSKVTWTQISDQYFFDLPNKQLDNDTVEIVCEMIQAGKCNSEIIKRCGGLVNRHHIRFIKQRKTFKHISENYSW